MKLNPMEIQGKLAQVIDLQEQIAANKLLYDKLAQLVLELKEAGFTSGIYHEMRLELVDNFAEGNRAVFRPAGVVRFEIKEAKKERAR